MLLAHPRTSDASSHPSSSCTYNYLPLLLLLLFPRSAWAYSEKTKRQTLQKADIQRAIRRTYTFDFLEPMLRNGVARGRREEDPEEDEK